MLRSGRPRLGLVMIVKDEVATLKRCIASAGPLIDSWTIFDTGSTDDTRERAAAALDGIPGRVHDLEWSGFGQARTAALAAARGSADWLLMLDADMTVEWHPDLLAWLADEPDPHVAAWMVEVLERGTRYRLPLLVRGDVSWRYRGATHEWLDLEGKKARPLLGLTVHHHADGASRPDKHERDLELLKPGLAKGDPRDTFYTAQALRFLGRVDEAISCYRKRAAMEGWDEETWYATYQAAKLAGDVGALLAVHEQRPWRHEPLSAAAELVGGQGARDDMLFLEPGP